MTALNNFRKHFQKIFLLGKDELSFVTKCLFPCNFIEYKESISFQFQLVSTSTISDTRYMFRPQLYQNKTTLWPIYTSNTIQVFKEEAFASISLLADIGGILGMFIGLNFLMVWDGILWFWQKYLANKIMKT